GEAGMTNDLFCNNKVVMYSEQVLQNDVSEYHQNLCIVSAIVKKFRFYSALPDSVEVPPYRSGSAHPWKQYVPVLPA
ncbi:MAG: hypothetical protein J6F32_08475, partial [Pseudomonas sp.]|nr:hypothetical protein [Pseudomonas sp.]